MNPIVRSRLVASLLASALVLGACSSGAGSAGTLPPAPTSSEPDASTSTSPTPATTSPTPGGSPAQGSMSPTASVAPTPTAAPATTSFAIYLLSGERLVPVHRQVPQTSGVARAAVTSLLAGPTPSEAAGPANLLTVVPQGTQLLDVSIANGVATVDLSGDFQSGGGSASMFGRLAQVTYTLTQFPTVKGVLFRLDGQPVTVFSSEGIVLSGPTTRADYQSFLPPIFLDRPAWGAPLANPARLTGLANVFEAQFNVDITTANGRVLASQPVKASCGTGCWGTFDVTIPYSVDQTQPGYVVVYDLSARDGSRENVRSYPVQLSPAG